MSELHTADVDLEGLLQVLSQNLYATPEVALRELVQNAHDACTRRELEHGPFEARIDVAGDAANGIITIGDNGAGLTHDEVIRYLATIGAGYTRLLRADHHDDRLIGAFGLGFLSAYIVADRVEVVTTSASAPGEAWQFSSRDGQRFTLVETPPGPIGMVVTLHVRARFAEWTRPVRLQAVLARYCALLPIPVFAPEQINAVPPPWRQQGLDPFTARRQREAFAASFEPMFEPLCTISLNPTDGIDAHGVLWVQDGATYGASDHRHVSVFVRGMLVSDDLRKLLPDWAGFAGAVLQCDALVPTASREDVQRDAHFQRLQAHVAETFIAGLKHVADAEPERWQRVRARHNEALLGAALSDERLFDWLCDELTVPTSEGDLGVAEVVAASGGDCVVTTGEGSGAESVLFRALSKPVVDGSRYGALAMARRYVERKGGRLVVLGTQGGDAAFFPKAPLEEVQLTLLERHLGSNGVAVVPTRFMPLSLPAVLVVDREAAVKRRVEDDETSRRITKGLLTLARSYTEQVDGSVSARLYVNLGNPQVEALLVAEEAKAASLAAIIRAVAMLASRSRVDGTDLDLGTSLEALSVAISSLSSG